MAESNNYVDAYYVDPKNGDDRNPGTNARPFKTIQAGVDLAGKNDNDGNKIYLKEGTYYLEQPLFIDRYSGEADSYLTIQSAPGEKAIIDGSRQTAWQDWQGGLIDIKNVSYVKISDLDIYNAPSHAIEVVNGQHIDITDNVIYRAHKMGIKVRGYMAEIPSERDTFQQSSDILIEGNGVYQTNLNNSSSNKGVNNWGAGIQAWNAKDVTITENIVGNNYGEGIGFSMVDNGKVINNFVYDNYSMQVYLDNTTDSVVANNFIYNTGDRRFYRQGHAANGIGFGNEVHNIAKPARFYSNNNQVKRNVIVGAGTGMVYGTWAGKHEKSVTNNSQGLKNTTIANNTVYNSQSHSIRFYPDSNNNNVDISNNIFYQEKGYNLSKVDSLSGIKFNRNLWWGGEPGSGENSSSDVIANPQFVNPGGLSMSDYQLKSSSKAIDAVDYSSDNSLNTYTLNTYSLTNSPAAKGDLGALEYGESVDINWRF